MAGAPAIAQDICEWPREDRPGSSIACPWFACRPSLSIVATSSVVAER